MKFSFTFIFENVLINEEIVAVFKKYLIIYEFFT